MIPTVSKRFADTSTILPTAILITISVVVLYWASALLVPLALAVFLTFILGTSVNRLRRLGLGRVSAVLVIVGLTGVVFLMVVWLVSSQLTSLVHEIPKHSDKITAKISTLRELSTPDPDGKLGKILTELEGLFKSPTALNAQVPLPVVFAPTQPNWLSGIQGAVGPVVEFLGQTGFTLVLAIFILLNREDLRNRVLRLIGSDRLMATTKAMDDAGNRISRYLRVQLAINVVFGLVLMTGFALVGVPFAVLWGFLAILMRYIPYIGSWIGIIPPTLVTLAMSSSWWPPIAVLLIYGAVELVVANVVDPRLLGHSLGMSEVAQIFSAALWAFLWGPVGFVLSGPLTACLLVLGKNVPQLQFLDVMLGIEEPLQPSVAFYQRLVARDADEASRIASDFAAHHSIEAVRDDVLVPTLISIEESSSRGELTADDVEAMSHDVREIAEDVGLLSEDVTPNSEHDEIADRPLVLLVPIGSPADNLVLDMVNVRLASDHWHIRRFGEAPLASDVAAAIANEPTPVVLIGAASGRTMQCRYLCKRLRAQYPDLKILIGRWGQHNSSANAELEQVGATAVCCDIPCALRQLQTWKVAIGARTESGPNKAGAKSNEQLDTNLAATELAEKASRLIAGRSS